MRRGKGRVTGGGGRGVSIDKATLQAFKELYVPLICRAV